ncbi:hypothetical protein AeMF1_020627 [Aphanomyces euteiches]|nr:hypothetical protein AeMF1_020627 [Aphanomyces euteiches]
MDKVDREGLTTLATAHDALKHVLQSTLVLKEPVYVMGQPPLLFAASMYDEELTLAILEQRHRLVVDVNVVDNHGLTPLHYAADSDMLDLAKALVECQDIDLTLTTEDLSLLGLVESGGRTALHLACLRGNLSIVELLMAKDPSLEHLHDWDGNTPFCLAQLHERSSVVKFFQVSQICSSNHVVLSPEALAERKQRQQHDAAMRYQDSLQVPEPFQKEHVLPQIWSSDECQRVLDALFAKTDVSGWQTKRHTAYPTTDLPSYCLPQIDVWVKDTLNSRLFPAIRAAYDLTESTQLSFRDLFYVKYEAAGPSVQNDLGLHCDGSILSFNILLNDAQSFQGGGTYFEATQSTVKIQQGQAVVHSGRVMHGAAPVLDGKRLILVGFLNVRELDFVVN